MEEEHVELINREEGRSKAVDVVDVDGAGCEAPGAIHEEPTEERRAKLKTFFLLAFMVGVAAGIGYVLGAEITKSESADITAGEEFSLSNGGQPVDAATSMDESDSAFTLHANATDFNATAHVAPKRIFLLGERNSGTNYVEEILSNSFHPRYSDGTVIHGRSLYNFAGCSPDAHPVQERTCSPIFKFKHMFRHSPLSAEEMQYLRERNDVLWILVVRSPCDWADAMFRKPWHLCSPSDPPAKCKGAYIGANPEALMNVSRSSFFSDLPWWENTEAREGSDFVYPGGVFDLRAHKLSLMLQLRNAVGPHRVKLGHLKYIEASPEMFVQNVAREFGLEVNKARKELIPSAKAHETLCLTDDEWGVAREKIDWKLEGEFGFNSLDCHTCVRRT